MTAPSAPAVAGYDDRLAPVVWLEENRRRFDALASEAEERLRRNDLAAAAVYSGAAAHSAAWMHPGLYASPKLERLVIEVARRARIGFTGNIKPGRVELPARVLHVFTSVQGIGGHTRMAWRWIDEDRDRAHSVAITRQSGRPIPQRLRDAVAGSGGALHVLDQGRGGVLEWARRLCDLAATADLVVLHVNPEDVVPLLAVADRSAGPPVVYLDHADHLFWLGVTLSDVVCALRESGLRLARRRRGVVPERSALLPIVLPRLERTMSRREAKRRLGLAEDGIVLLTMARGVKYRPLGGTGLADVALPVLELFERAALLLVGPEMTPDLRRAAERTGGRVAAVGPQADTAPFVQAADVYLDSYPLVSTTSLLEAGSYGVPLLSLPPLGRAAGESVLCADMPGLSGCLVQARDVEDYRAQLAALLRDEVGRLALGLRTREQILATHTGEGWRAALLALYRQTAGLTGGAVRRSSSPRWRFDAEDLATIRVLSAPIARSELMRHHVTLLPFGARLRECLRAPRSLRWSQVLPEWLAVRCRTCWKQAKGLLNRFRSPVAK